MVIANLVVFIIKYIKNHNKNSFHYTFNESPIRFKQHLFDYIKNVEAVYL